MQHAVGQIGAGFAIGCLAICEALKGKVVMTVVNEKEGEK